MPAPKLAVRAVMDGQVKKVRVRVEVRVSRHVMDGQARMVRVRVEVRVGRHGRPG